MDYKKILEDSAVAHLSNRQIARQLYFLAPSFAFEGSTKLQLDLYEKICTYLKLPLSSIRLVGSRHTGFSLVKNTPFDKTKSDLDIAIVDSALYLDFFQLAFEITDGWRDVTKFPGSAKKQSETKKSFLGYLRKGVIRPDLMPSSPEKAAWDNFFGKLGDEYSEFCNGISAGIYARELFMAAKQESALDAYFATQWNL